MKILKPICKGINMVVKSPQQIQNKHILTNSCILLQQTQGGMQEAKCTTYNKFSEVLYDFKIQFK